MQNCAWHGASAQHSSVSGAAQGPVGRVGAEVTTRLHAVSWLCMLLTSPWNWAAHDPLTDLCLLFCVCVPIPPYRQEPLETHNLLVHRNAVRDCTMLPAAHFYPRY